MLSARCRHFLATALVSSRVVDVSGDRSDPTINARLATALNGVVLPLFGGDLRDDWCLIGHRHAERGLKQGNLIRVAEPAFAQCAIVASEDGRLGFSWAGEFLPRYSGLLHFLESSSVWFSHKGWYYSDLVSLIAPEAALAALPECEPIREASGEQVKWWTTGDCSIYAEPHIASPVPSPVTVTVLARSQEVALSLRGELAGKVHGQRPAWLLPRLRPVGDNHPQPPMEWGPFIEQHDGLRRFLDQDSEGN